MIDLYGKGTEDALIYPLVFAIRHCVELSLKISINLIRDLYFLFVLTIHIDISFSLVRSLNA